MVRIIARVKVSVSVSRVEVRVGRKITRSLSASCRPMAFSLCSRTSLNKKRLSALHPIKFRPHGECLLEWAVAYR